VLGSIVAINCFSCVEKTERKGPKNKHHIRQLRVNVKEFLCVHNHTLVDGKQAYQRIGEMQPRRSRGGAIATRPFAKNALFPVKVLVNTQYGITYDHGAEQAANSSLPTKFRCDSCSRLHTAIALLTPPRDVPSFAFFAKD